jgi:peptidyl-prolyl cis-trans isomerase D
MIKFLQTPSRAKKIILGGLLLIICAAMVITLVPGGFLGDAFGVGSPGQGVLAKVGDHEVTYVEAQQMARNMVRQQFSGRSVPSQLMPLFVQRAVQDLILQKAMLVEAERMGLRVNDAELAEYLQHGPFTSQLFPNGQFIGPQAYENFVQAGFNLSVPQFEGLLKNELLTRKLRNVVEASAMVSDSELRKEFVKKNTKVKFEYAVLTQEDISKQIKPGDAELKAYFEKNKNNYTNAIPEKRKAQYVYIDSAKLKGKAQVTPDDLKRYYNQHIDEYRVPEEVKVRHILIKTPPPGADGKPAQKGIDTAKAKAEDLLKKIKAGANFAELARRNSEDPGSASQGGELGWIGRGRTVPEFEKAAFSLKPGETSDLVQSSYGFHIIQVEDKHTAHVKTLDEVKAQIEPVLAAEKASQQAETLASTVETQARATGGLQAAAQKNGLELHTTPLVARTDSIPNIGAAPEFMSALFSARLNNPPERVRLPAGYAIFQVQEIKPPQTPTFEEIKSRVEEDFRRERAGQLLTQKLQELSDRARAGHNLKKAAAEAGATVKTSELVLPDQQVPDIGSFNGPASLVFDMKPGEISAPIQTQRGGVVVALLEKQEPNPADFDKQKDQLREELLSKKRSQMLDLFLDSLRTRMEKEGKIRVNKQELDRLTPKQEAS